MARKNKLLAAPPFAVEDAAKRLGDNLRIARLRRNLTIEEVAEKIGAGVRAVSAAEKGKISTGLGVYLALLWTYDLLEQLDDVADPIKDEEGKALALTREGVRARHSRGDIDDEF